jgi:hypothetical protein
MSLFHIFLENLSATWRRVLAVFAVRFQTAGSHEATSTKWISGPDVKRILVNVIESNGFDPDADVVVLVLFCAEGTPSRLQQEQISAYCEAGYSVVLVVNTCQAILAGSECAEKLGINSRVSILIVRDNVGYDFGAWATAIEHIGGLDSCRTLTFTNDSILPLDVSNLRRLRIRCRSERGVVFLTSNTEIKPHAQSYFFVLAQPPTFESAFRILVDLPLYRDKENLIQDVELRLRDLFEEAEIETCIAFPHARADETQRNPTIHFWHDLVLLGFPFLKIQLFARNFVSLEDLRLSSLMRMETAAYIREHLQARGSLETTKLLDQDQPSVRAFATESLYEENGAMQAFNPHPDTRPSVSIPFTDSRDYEPGRRKVLVVLHVFYVEIGEQIIRRLIDLDVQVKGITFDIIVTTDNDDKVSQLHSRLGGIATYRVLVCENRGRDVAPLFRACETYLDNHELILHLHTKKSPHDPQLELWGDYLYACLVGTGEVIRSIMLMFDEPQMGLVHAGHYRVIGSMRNWGFDFPAAQMLLSQLGISISGDTVLDFPSSTMFWMRSDAIRDLMNLGLHADKFEAETGQYDGTLAHSIERILSYVTEERGLTVQSVVRSDKLLDYWGATLPMSVSQMKRFVSRIQVKLTNSTRPPTKYNESIEELYDVAIAASGSDRVRLSVILPTIQPDKIFGGVSTAIREAMKLFNAIGDCDLRFIVTSDKVDRKSVSALAKRIGRVVTRSSPEGDGQGVTLVPLHDQRYRPVSIRKGERVFATAWWTADAGFRIRDAQTRMFGIAPPLVYLIQDYEPAFYNWSSRYSLALATLNRPSDTIAIVNSEELSCFLDKRLKFDHAYVLPFELEPLLKPHLRPAKKEEIVVVYGRPSVDRNAFELVVEGVRRWQARFPTESGKWKVIFVGESFKEAFLSELVNSQVLGKLNIVEYGSLLSRASIGLSIMISPHPSYPPMEMISAGLATITNQFESKDLALRADNVVSLVSTTPDSIANGLQEACKSARVGFELGQTIVRTIESPYPEVNYREVAELLMRNSET